MVISLLAIVAFAVSFFFFMTDSDELAFPIFIIAAGLLFLASERKNNAWLEGYKCADAGGEVVDLGDSYRCNYETSDKTDNH